VLVHGGGDFGEVRGEALGLARLQRDGPVEAVERQAAPPVKLRLEVVGVAVLGVG